MGFPNIKMSDYTYSESVVIRKWSHGQISVKIGYVRKHPEKNCIVLEKRWKSSKDWTETKTFNIKNGQDWKKITAAIEKLWPELKDSSTGTEIDEAVDKLSSEFQLLELLAKYPGLLSQVPKDIDILSMPTEYKEALRKLLSVGGSVASLVIKKMAEQPIEDLDQFVKLLEELRLSTINSLVTHVTSRLKFIHMFEKVILNNNSYERRGINSIHNLLRLNIWMIDRNYSVLHNDVTLKSIILKEWGKKADGESSRPDFLCMTDPLSEEKGYKKLVIIEIKRPLVKIKFKHIDQIMGYRAILQKHSGKSINDFTCYLVGREVDYKLQLNDLSRSGFIVKTYTDFIRDARNFYREYLKIIEEEKLAF